MPRFVFRLQSVLDYRQQLEDLAKVAFGEAQGGFFKEEATLRRLRDDEARTVNHLEAIQGEGILDMENLQLGLRFLDVLKISVDRQVQVVERARARVEARRNELVEAMQARKALEKLKEKQLAEYRKAEQQRELKEMDEMAVMRHGLEGRRLLSSPPVAAVAIASSGGGIGRW
ncbi:MAG: flagellar export protein FliJ [Chloroflexi bacterium]|jgi:flagellar FliJ protein|nr:flagellar export protein FliJ [Chloroflexota bacterium]